MAATERPRRLASAPPSQQRCRSKGPSLPRESSQPRASATPTGLVLSPFAQHATPSGRRKVTNEFRGRRIVDPETDPAGHFPGLEGRAASAFFATSSLRASAPQNSCAQLFPWLTSCSFSSFAPSPRLWQRRGSGPSSRGSPPASKCLACIGTFHHSSCSRISSQEGFSLPQPSSTCECTSCRRWRPRTCPRHRRTQ